MAKNSIRGYGLEIGIAVFKYCVFVSLTPLNWRKPLMTLPPNKLFGSWHFLLGPIHMYGMPIGDFARLSIDVNYNHFWWDCVTVPEGYKRIF
jgi:hypothetical protein